MEEKNPVPRIRPAMLATVCLPIREGGGFDEGRFRRAVSLLYSAGAENLYIFGTAGEGYALTDEMFRDVASVFCDATRGHTGIRQLGVIAMSVPQILARIELGLELGFRDFQISLPPWGTLTDRELGRFFREVLDPYPEAKFLHYNTIRAGRILTGREYARIAAEHPNLVATKSGGHSAASLLTLFEEAPLLCHFVTELDYAVASLLGKDCGLLVSIGALNPGRARAFFEAGRRGDAKTLRSMVRELYSIRGRILETVAGEGAHMDGAYDKLYSRFSDPEFPLDLISPYGGAGVDAFERLGTWLSETWPEWMPGTPGGKPGGTLGGMPGTTGTPRKEGDREAE